MIKIEIGKNDKGQRLDRFLKKYFDAAPLSLIYKLIRKDVKVNGKRGKQDTMLGEGDVLTIYITEEQAREFHRDRNRADFAQFGDGQGARGGKRTRTQRQFKVAYEDEKMLIVSKPFGLLTHGDKKEKKNTLANQVAGYLQEKGEYDPATEQTFRPSPVNRLDRNTTGLVIFGKTAEATRRLAADIRTRDGIGKYYLTIVKGEIAGEMLLDDDLVKDGEANRVSAVRSDVEANRDGAAHSHENEMAGDNETAQAKKSITIIRPLAVAKLGKRGDKGSVRENNEHEDGRVAGRHAKGNISNCYTLVEAELVTGRTHQIRVHLASAGHPIIGDSKYGDRRVNRYFKEKYDLSTQLLHAARLEFEHEGGIMKVTAPLPKKFEKIKVDIFGNKQ